MVEGWIPVKIGFIIRYKDGQQKLFDPINFQYETMLLPLLGIFESKGIPIYDPYNIGQILLEKKDVNQHLYHIWKNDADAFSKQVEIK